MTKQHVWPDWLKSVIPRVGNKHSRLTTRVTFDQQKVTIVPKLHEHNGAIGSHKLRIVCASCNNGWMSQIEQQSKSLLTDLIKGIDIVLDKENQQLLCDWIMMTTMVAEFTDHYTISIPYEHRNSIKNELFPPGWKIWIGRYEGIKSTPYYKHHGARLVSINRDTNLINQTGLYSKFNTQFSTFIVGQLFIHVASTMIVEQQFETNEQMNHFLKQLYPIVQTEIKLDTLQTINDVLAYSITDYFIKEKTPNKSDFEYKSS
jgi:hypothetical protein